jgi:hypothetical protein
MSLSINSGRQNRVVAEQRIPFGDLVSGVAQAAMLLPNGAYNIVGKVIPIAAFNSATSDTLDVGTAASGAAYGNDLNIHATTITNLTGLPNILTDDQWLYVNWTGTGAVPTAGEVILSVEYSVIDRSQYDIGPNTPPTP